jgi:3-hydroxyacyl-CoA dehydrogenase / enoyl-CoA hydratase / 3-hydroxybutyryl-CoA epimerase / enoyl-CoA isomerase
MHFQGQAFRVEERGNSIVTVVFDLKDQSANVFNALALKELAEALTVVKKIPHVKGLLFTSGKDGFVFGADVTEFLGHFKKSEEEMRGWLLQINATFSGFEDLPYPTVAAVNGFALGGGFEIALTTDFRVCGTKAQLGLPETKLGIIPGWGGTVRLPRLIGADHAIEWITSGKHYKADEALKFGAVDAVVEDSKTTDAALLLLERAISGEIDWKARRAQKTSPLKLDKVESMMSFEGSKGFVAGMAGPHYPAPVQAIESIQQGARKTRDEALVGEGAIFAKMAKTPTAECLVQVFLGDQYLKKISKKMTKETPLTKHAAVLGAGIMGGGIAYQSATSGVPALMKDIKPEQLDLGMGEATKLLNKLVEIKKLTPEKMARAIAAITPTLSYADFNICDFVVEAVVENEKVKKAVLADAEIALPAGAILSSNTSTISITRLAEGLKRPENFIGMHFFNPVHKMPLVEIIRGKHSSDAAIARGVQYATQMGKTPIVVNDCAGFLVNRVLFPYFFAFTSLLEDGVDFQKIDKVMEKWGWPMGPAYLLDVVGIDTGHKASAIMATDFPDRMQFAGKSILESLYEAQRYGQKNNKGFYEYELDKKGKPKKLVTEAAYTVIKPHVKKSVVVTDEEIIMRMMIPMLTESARCLEEKIANTPIEIDMALLLGLGFPPFRAGVFKWADMVGLKKIEEESKKWSHLGKIYDFTPTMQAMVQTEQKYHAGGAQ